GNLQLAIKTSEDEYDLLLQQDIGTMPGRHNQWFYFSVTNLRPDRQYKFSIINMSKSSSQFGEGMQPVVLSSSEGIWRRLGDFVCFYRNQFRKPPEAKPGSSQGSAKSTRTSLASATTYSTLTFCLSGRANDTYFVAYHYPYTYSDLVRFLDMLQNELYDDSGEKASPAANSRAFDLRCRRQTLCHSEGGNEVEMLTITAFDEGTIQFLLGDEQVAQSLRRRFVFKIVPMLNPDGVINGR
ncbi:Cytosolic carboxypeptidase 4, partial [Cladochytrium tenue]